MIIRHLCRHGGGSGVRGLDVAVALAAHIRAGRVGEKPAAVCAQLGLGGSDALLLFGVVHGVFRLRVHAALRGSVRVAANGRSVTERSTNVKWETETGVINKLG